jgi:hypothetical protein
MYLQELCPMLALVSLEDNETVRSLGYFIKIEMRQWQAELLPVMLGRRVAN